MKEYLLCVPVFLYTEKPILVSMKDQCHKCGEDVWIKPSTWFVRYDHPDMLPICIFCFCELEGKCVGIMPPYKAELIEMEEYRQGRLK